MPALTLVIILVAELVAVLAVLCDFGWDDDEGDW